MPAIHYGKSCILKEADYYYHLFADDEWEEFLEKLKEDQAKHTKWVMGEKIVFDEGKQRVKQQENVLVINFQKQENSMLKPHIDIKHIRQQFLE